MKKILLPLVSCIFISSNVKAFVSFEYLFQKPNSDYFYTCSFQQCGSWLGEQYQLLINDLRTVSGEYNISEEYYEYLNQLDIKVQ